VIPPENLWIIPIIVTWLSCLLLLLALEYLT
jgi:hypothetical protein